MNAYRPARCAAWARASALGAALAVCGWVGAPAAQPTAGPDRPLRTPSPAGSPGAAGATAPGKPAGGTPAAPGAPGTGGAGG
ncbi:MAG: hypothetical protein HY744_21360, partial [Deltaproteobacteria bacterium]|nr:hypothetical protein [Deltaproteobacteria bacterium]